LLTIQVLKPKFLFITSATDSAILASRANANMHAPLPERRGCIPQLRSRFFKSFKTG